MHPLSHAHAGKKKVMDVHLSFYFYPGEGGGRLFERRARTGGSSYGQTNSGNCVCSSMFGLDDDGERERGREGE